MNPKKPELLESIRTKGEITEDTEKGLATSLDEFARTFA